MPAARRPASSSRAPGRNGTPVSAELPHDVIRQVVDDVAHAHAHARVLEDARRILEADPDEAQRLLVRPACRRSSRRAASRPPSSTARCRRGFRPCPRGRRRAEGAFTGPCYRPAVTATGRGPGHGLAGRRSPRSRERGPILEGARRAGGGGRVDGLGRRVLVAAFDGWNDAGEAASSAIAHLREQRELRDRVLDRPRAVLRLPVHAPADRDRRRGQAHAALARGDAAQARSAPRAARSCGCSPASSPHAPGRPSPRSSSTSRCARTSPAWSRSAR